MAVQFADIALDDLLSLTIKIAKGHKSSSEFEAGYLQALIDTQKNLHSLWGARLEEPSGEES